MGQFKITFIGDHTYLGEGKTVDVVIDQAIKHFTEMVEKFPDLEKHFGGCRSVKNIQYAETEKEFNDRQKKEVAEWKRRLHDFRLKRL